MERIRGLATGPLLLLGPHGLQRELWKITLITFPLHNP